MKKHPKHSHREMALLEALHRLGGSARSAELAKTLDVSEETVRRTIKALSRAGVLERMYGGAFLAGPGKVPTFFTDDGQVLYDSRVICEYLNDLAQGSLMPATGRARWETLTLLIST